MHEKQTYTLYLQKWYGVEKLMTRDLEWVVIHMAKALLSDAEKRVYRMELDANAKVRVDIRAVGEDRFTSYNALCIRHAIYQRIVRALEEQGLPHDYAASKEAYCLEEIQRQDMRAAYNQVQFDMMVERRRG